MRSLAKRSLTRQSARVFRHRRSSGLTIMELLIASAIALLMVAGLVTAFKVISDQVAIARATLELSGQLRSGTHRIREDLKNVSAPVRPWLRPSNGQGYFEYIEGPLNDASFANGNASIYGDIDDILMFTARTEGEPFVGRYNGGTITSREAEIILWTELVNEDQSTNSGVPTWSPGEQVVLHRRVLLIRPDLTQPPDPTKLIPAGTSLVDFYANNDVSVSFRQVQVRDAVTGNLNTETRLIANSIADLTKRENRFGHLPTFPHAVPVIQPYEYLDASNSVQYSPFRRSVLTSLVQTGANQGNDILLSNILAFDVQAYDPGVAVRVLNNKALLPHDLRYAAGTEIGRGGYVDLYYGGSDYDLFYDGNVKNPKLSPFSDPLSFLEGPPLAIDPSKRLPMATYCTWSFHYEKDGLDQDDGGSGPIDEGTDGFDSDSQNGVDDPGERETTPPYRVPLRGVKVTIRVYEPDSQRVRQMSTIQDFIPE